MDTGVARLVATRVASSQLSQLSQQGHSSWWGRIPSLHRGATNWTPLRPIHLPGTLQAPSPVRAQPAAHCPLCPSPDPCSGPQPHPCLPSLGPCLSFPQDLAAPTRRLSPNESPAALGLSAAHAVYSAGFGAVGHRQPWALVPAAWLTSAQPCSVWGVFALFLLSPAQSLQHKPFPVGCVTWSLGLWSCGRARGIQAPSQALGRGAEPRTGEGPARQLGMGNKKSTGGASGLGRAVPAPAALPLPAQGWKHSTGSLESGRMLQLMGQRMPRRPRDCWQRSSAARHTARQGCSTPPSGVHLGTKRLQMSRRRCW